MNDASKAPRQALADLNGNLWEWRGANPYEEHPLQVLGIDHEPDLTPQVIAAAVKKLALREQQSQRAGMLSGRARELLMDPVARIFCELMRIPPVALPKDDIERVKRAAEERYKNRPDLPPVDDLTVQADNVLQHVVEAIVAEEPGLDPLPAVDIDAAPPLEIERQRFAGIVFRQRSRREA